MCKHHYVSPPRSGFTVFGRNAVGKNPSTHRTGKPAGKHIAFMFARRPEVGFAHKEKLSYEQRCYESTRVREKYSDRFPVIVEKDGKSDVPDVDKCAVATTACTRDSTHTHAIQCMHISQARADHTLPTLATCHPHTCYPSTLSTRSSYPQVQVLDPARHDDGPAGVRAAQADRRARGAGDLCVCRKHATTGERARQQRGACRPSGHAVARGSKRHTASLRAHAAPFVPYRST
jgi:hypothetical protein